MFALSRSEGAVASRSNVPLVTGASRQADESGFFGYDFAVFPYVDRRAVHARGLAGYLGGAANCPAHSG